ncbi:histone deacetylase complex subunit SAP18-like [Oppia nitens]|uniref:histone deacetylase complex subunit SAP18-like n=1 Tax=Oppia nitens TaxID=1686743 RepID=UPI0023DAB2CC|nr:histone deacetylase complex subunit SAP18-like [Oppia nitens]
MSILATAMTSHVVTAEPVAEEKPIDREKKCPLLLRVFLSMNGRHNNCNEFSRNECPPNELQVYTWTDATLKEITGLVKEVNPDARRKGTFFDFALVYPDPRGPIYRMRDIGTTCSGVKNPDDIKTLADCRFQIGDYLDIAIQTPTDRRPVNRRDGGGGGYMGRQHDRRDRPY